MGGLTIELDAAGSNADGTNPGTAYLLDSTNGYSLLGFNDPMSEWAIQWAGSIDTEGDLIAAQKPVNRAVTITVRLAKATAATLETEIQALNKKVGKLQRNGGTIKVTTPGGNIGYYDVRHGGAAFDWSVRMLRTLRAEITVTLPCAPFIRGAETSITLGTPATAAGWHVYIASTSVPGDVSALGRLTVTDSSGSDQWQALWAVENNAAYTHTGTSGSASLVYEAESRTVLGGSSVVTGPTGASGGASNNVVRNTALATTDQAILSTQASGGGSHLSHVGTFRVYARVQTPITNAGDVTLTLAWGVGDFRRFTLNSSVVADQALFSNVANWHLIDLGLVTIPPARAGATQRWEGRILARSTTAGDDIDIDAIALDPADYASGRVSALPLFQTPTSFSARDEFDQSAGALAGKTLPVGGTWAGAGDADDYSVETTGHTAQRTAVSDTSGNLSNGRMALAGTATLANVHVQVSAKFAGSISVTEWGVFARYVDTSNWVAGVLQPGSTNSFVAIVKCVSGTQTTLALLGRTGYGFQIPGEYKSMRLQVDDQGRVFLWVFTPGLLPGTPLLSAQDAVLATGGTLATGRFGFFDHHDSATACTRSYDDFAVGVPTKDAAIFASQSLEIAWASVEREDSSGTFWTPVSDNPGDMVRVPPAGQENRAARVLVKTIRNDAQTMPDSAIDSVTTTLAVIPRYLTMPD